LVLCVWFLLIVNTSATDCLERLVPEVIYYVSRGTLNSAHSLTNHSFGYLHLGAMPVVVSTAAVGWFTAV